MSEFIDGYDEKAIEIERTFSYDGYQIVRREMFAHLREPAVTIRSDSITFNTACIDGLEDDGGDPMAFKDYMDSMVKLAKGQDDGRY